MRVTEVQQGTRYIGRGRRAWREARVLGTRRRDARLSSKQCRWLSLQLPHASMPYSEPVARWLRGGLLVMMLRQRASGDQATGFSGMVRRGARDNKDVARRRQKGARPLHKGTRWCSL